MKLLIRLPNWVGDACMALPAIQALAERGVDVELIGKGWAADLFAAHGWPVTKLPAGLRPAAQAIRARGIGRGLLLTNSFGSALQFRLGGVRAVGYRRECRTLLLGRGVPKAVGGHEVDVFWRLAQEVAAWLALPPLPAAPPPQLGLHLSPAARADATAALTAAGVVGPYVLLCPLAAGTVNGQDKKWPGFPLLARILRDEGRTLVACPGPGEDAACAAAVPGAILVPGLKLAAYAAVAAGADITIANDSGPMHLAAAVGAPVIGIFGVSAPTRTRPWAASAQVIGTGEGWPAPTDVRSLISQTKSFSPEVRKSGSLGES